MTSVENKRNDTKLLLAVGALVVVGAAGIALIGGLALDDEAEQTRAAPPLQEPTASYAEPATPAFAVAPSAPVDALANFAVTPATPPVEEEADTIVVDPSEDFVTRGLAEYAARDFARSAAYFQAEVDARPDRSWTHHMLGLALWKAGRGDEAAIAMEAAVTLDPGSVRSLVNLARIRNDLGDYTGALEAARAGLAIDGTDPSARFLEGRSLFNLGRVDEAVGSLTASAAIDPDNGYVQNLLGLARMRQGRPVEAAEVLTRAVELQPQVAYIHNNLGMALELSGRRPEAVLAYSRSVELDPSHTKAVINLARLEPTAGADPAPVEPASGEIADVTDEGVAVAVADSSVVP